MWGLYSTEGGWVGSSQINRDGSHDLGPMQINDATWVKPIAKLMFGGDEVKARDALQWNGCFNAEVSAWGFHKYWAEDHGNLAAAVGHYNSHNPDAMKRYQLTYEKRFLALYGSQLKTQPIAALPPLREITAASAPSSTASTKAPSRRTAAPVEKPVEAFLSGTLSPPTPR